MLDSWILSSEICWADANRSITLVAGVNAKMGATNVPDMARVVVTGSAKTWRRLEVLTEPCKLSCSQGLVKHCWEQKPVHMRHKNLG